jgi:DNA-binding transcriptional ArsR family regulator
MAAAPEPRVMSLLPSSPDTSAADGAEPRVVGVDSDRADELMSALSSETARQLLMELHEDPAPPSELSDRVDTSLQNAQYHLGNLKDAGAVEVIDTIYSEKGREMDIYAPADRPLVLFAGREEQSHGLRAALRDLVTGVAGVALGAVVVQELFGRSVLASLTSSLGGAGSAGGGGAAPPEPTPTVTETATRDGVAGGGNVTATTATDQPGAFDATPTATPSGDEAAAPTSTATGSPTPQATGTPAATPEPTGTPTEMAMDTAAETTRTLTEAAATGLQLPPGLLFFLGGLVALLVVLSVSYYR